MAPFRFRILSVLAFATPACAATTDAVPAPLSRLLALGATTLPDQADDCFGDEAQPTVGGTVAAILGELAGSGSPLAIAVTCEPADRGKRFCTLTFADPSEDAPFSAGFTYLEDARAHRIEPGSLRCFRTP